MKRSKNRLAWATCLPLIALFLYGCRVAEQSAQLPMRLVTTVTPGTGPKQPDPEFLQTEVLRFADDFGGQADRALDELARRGNSAEVQHETARWRLSLHSAILSIATGPNPFANLMDLVALTALTHAVMEERAPVAVPPGSLNLLLETSRRLETNAWKLAHGVLTAEQERQFRVKVEEWCARNAKLGISPMERSQAISSFLHDGRGESSDPGSIFGLLGLDPVAGLDPAVREVTRTRLFAERGLFAVQRLPLLIRLQSELLAEQVLGQEQVTNALRSIDRLSSAAESASQTAALLPDRFTAERKAVLDALETEQGQLRDLAAELGRTLAAGDKMAGSVDNTIRTFDGLMKRFGVGEPATAPRNTNAPPFNILDYAHTAEQIAAMARQLDALLKNTTGAVDTPALDKRIADLNALADKAHASARALLNYAFLLAAALILLAFALALVYRRTAPRGLKPTNAQVS